ncbi:hypothetical protein D9611_013451 [Ephemerocybe angulata]|uniref:Uncharacterized protein n=1 Tax=Ephemerocybe angulata TaxID=980116 RepID=A0A8H5FB36_9AGAR|nr:hypothetical protein D9611_013451 [Tulosesus angulatus]
MPCEASENQLAIDESKFWDANGIHWSPHRIGWAIAGGCTALEGPDIVGRNYTNPRQQRQIIALYGLLVFYGLMAEELKGKRPVAKFLSIKLIVMFTFYQAFVFKALQGRVIHATTYWTETNIANGLNALAICVEMVIFSGLMWWAYTAKEYTRQAGIWRPLWDSINYMDFFREIGYSFRFFFTRKPHPESVSVVESKSSSIPYQATPSMQYRTVPQQDQRMSFAEAFGIAEYQQHPHHEPRNEVAGNAYPLTARNSDPEERQRLRPAVSPHLEPTFPQQHLKPGVESQRPLSEGEDLDLGYYSSAAYEGIEEPQVLYPQQGPQPAYPPQPPQQLQPGYNAAAGARDSFQAWTGPRAL